MKAVILAAGRGTRLEPLTLEVPKCMVKVRGVPMIDRLIARVREAGIDEIVVVSGHLHEVLSEHLAGSGCCVVYNERYHDWGNFYSLLIAREAVGDDGYVKLDGDVVMDGGVLPKLLAAPGDAVLALDRRDGLGAEEMKARLDGQRVVELNKRMDPAAAFGEYIGVEKVTASLAPRVFDKLAAMIDLGETDEYYERGYERMMADGVAFGYVDVAECTWTEIDDARDLKAAESMAAAGRV